MILYYGVSHILIYECFYTHILFILPTHNEWIFQKPISKKMVFIPSFLTTLLTTLL